MAKAKIAKKQVKQLYVAVYHHEYGVDVWVFYFVPNGDLEYPSPRAVAEHFNIDFEPNKGESFELVVANENPDNILATSIINGMHFGRTDPAPGDWYEETEEGWVTKDDRDDDDVDATKVETDIFDMSPLHKAQKKVAKKKVAKKKKAKK